MRKNTVVLLAVILALFAAACGSDNDGDDGASGSSAESGGSSSDAPSVDDMSPEELEVWQTDLNAVGCYAGAVDGALGPQTEAAIVAFQTAQGLEVDGLLGPETEAALEEAVAAGETVCTSSSGGETQGPETSASLESGSYSGSFALGSCSVNADVSNISLRGQADNISLAVDATEGTGSLAVAGGTEQDGIELNGDVTAVQIADDGSFTVTGTFTEPNFAGEDFTLSGSCPS